MNAPARLSARVVAACVAAACVLGADIARAQTTVAHDAAFVSQTVPPAFEIFATASVSITMGNTGLATWMPGDVFLATQEPQDNYYWCIQDNPYGSHSGNRVLLPRPVAAGETVTFDFVVKPLGCIFAAAAPLRFRMLSQTAGTFGEETPDPGSTVTTASEFVAQQVPTPVPAGAKVTAYATFRNTTQVTWTTDGTYTLVGANGADATWSIAPTPLLAPVAPGATGTIRMRLTAPATAGTYPLQVQMSQGGKAFGQLSTAASIVVVAAGAPNYQGLWWAAPAGSESGWGINFAHQGDVIFATWFTYDTMGKAWWLTLTAGLTNAGTYTGDILASTGPPFSSVPFRPTGVSSTRVGTGTLTFADTANATFDYMVNGVTQTKKLTPEAFGDLPTCTFNLVNDLSVAFNYQDLWWASPAGVEAGWGINLAHQGDVIFATWFTYASDGSPMWVAATLTKGSDGSYSGKLLRTTGPSFDSVPFDPKAVTVTEVGTLQLAFTNGLNGTMNYTLDGVTQSKAITRQVFDPPGTICQ